MQFILNNRLIFGILLFGLIIRILWLFLVPGNFIPSSDDYDLIARNIIAGKGFSIHPPKPTAERMPIYPFFLMTLYKIFGRNIEFVCTLQAFIDMITCFVIFKTALIVFDSRRIAHFTAFLYAIYVPYFTLVGVIMNEILFNLFFSIFIFFLLKYYKNLNLKNSFLLGLLLGIATLIRETPFVLFPLLLLVPFIMIRGWKKSLKISLVMLLGFLVLYTPWLIRNAVTFQKIVILSTHSGFNLYTNYYFIPDPIKGQPIGVLEPETHSRLLQQTEVDMDHELMRRALKIIKDNPGHSLKVFFENFFDFWFNLSYFTEKRFIMYYPVGGEMFSFSYTILFFNGFLLLFGFLGIIRLRKNWSSDCTILLIVIASFNLLHMVFVCYVRHSMPVLPYLMMFASSFIFHMFSKSVKFAPYN